MSTGLELIPIAIAIGVAVSKARKPTLAEHDPGTYAMETRARDAELLAAAVALHARDAQWHGETLVATLSGVPVNLVRPTSDGSFEAILPGDVPAARAQQALLALDETYTGLVQRRVREQVLRDAAANGMTVAHEHVEDDDTIVLTLTVDGTA